jgi:hypothetical protein
MRMLVAAAFTGLLAATPALCASYPVSGKWLPAAGDAAGSEVPHCGQQPVIAFAGDRRFDTGGKAPADYRNVSIRQTDRDTYRIVDLFFTGLQKGQVEYILKILGPNRIDLRFFPSNTTVALRRCR